MENMPQISEAEYEVMKVVWKYEPISTPEIVDKVLQKIDWKPNTVQTMLTRLEKKKALKAEKVGRAFVYQSLIEQYEFVEKKSKLFLNQFFGGTLNSMRSEEHTSELQSRFDLVCRLLLEKKK